MQRRAHDPESVPPNHPRGGNPFTGLGRIFSRYAHLWAALIACLPVPLSWLEHIPTYQAQRGYFVLYSSVFCFLILGYVIYARDIIVRYMKFPKTTLPTLFAPLLPLSCSVLCVVLYHITLDSSIEEVIDTARRQGAEVPSGTVAVLSATDGRLIPYSHALFGFYLGMFVFAELTFLIFAIKEYTQQELSDMRRAG